MPGAPGMGAGVAYGEPGTGGPAPGAPGYGLPPKHLPDVLGRKAARDLRYGQPLAWDMIADA